MFKQKGLAQKDIAMTLGYSQAYLSLMNNGARRIPDDFVKRIRDSFPFITATEIMQIEALVVEAQKLFDEIQKTKFEYEKKEVLSMVAKMFVFIQQEVSKEQIRQLSNDIAKKVQELAEKYGEKSREDLCVDLILTESTA